MEIEQGLIPWCFQFGFCSNDKLRFTSCPINFSWPIIWETFSVNKNENGFLSNPTVFFEFEKTVKKPVVPKRCKLITQS